MDKTIKFCSGRLFYFGVALLMALGLLLPAATMPAAAAEPDSEWQMVETPNMDDWAVAPGSDAYLLALGLDGETIYVIGTMWVDYNSDGKVTSYDGVNATEETAKLWKSENGGATWKDITENVLKAVERRPAGENEFAWFNYIAVPMDDSDFIVLAGHLGNMTLPGVPDAHNYTNWKQVVLVSEDGGKKFKLLSEPIRDTSAGTELTDIYSINVAPQVDGVRQIAIAGTSDPDHSVRLDTSAGSPNADGDETGLIYRYQYGGEEYWEDAVTGAPGWVNCSAVPFLWFSQTMFLSDNTLVAFTARIGGPWGQFSDNKTYVQTGVWTPEEDVCWNDQAKRGKAVLLDNRTVMWWTLKATAGGVTLPLDYDGRDKDKRYLLARVNVVDTTLSPLDELVGTIYTIDHDIAEPLEKQLPGQPWLGMVYYWGTISEGKVVAGVLGLGNKPDYTPSVSFLVMPLLNLYLMTDLNFGADLNYPPRLCQGPQVYRNELTDMNTDARWKAASKPPSGHLAAVPIIAPPAGNKVYCLVTPLTMGIIDVTGSHMMDKYDEGAFQVSFDDGDTWQQIGLIDTDMDYLADVAPSPDGNTTYLASINVPSPEIYWGGNSFDICDSLWLKSSRLSDELPQARDYDDHWLRVWYGEITSNFSLLRLAPEETTDIDHVYLAEWNTSTLYHSDSRGLGEWEVDTKAPFDIVDLAVKAADAVYALSADGDVALFDGSRWPSANRVDSELKRGNTIAVLGDNGLVGGTSGDVSYSSDGGLTFAELEHGIPGNGGNVSVAFDSYFDTNRVVYAAVSGCGVYRWTIDESKAWEDLGADALGYTGIVLDKAGNPQTSAATGGVLYALYRNWTANQSGVARCLTPASEKCCGAVDWDYLEQGETGFDDAFLFARSLKIYGCLTPATNSILLAIDFNASYYGGLLLEEQPAGTSRLGRLWSYQDCFAKAAPVMTAPADDAVINSDPCNCWNDAFTLKWERQCDACEYDIQIATDPEFTELAVRYNGPLPVGDWNLEFVEVEDGTNPSYVVPNRGLGDGSCGSTYYWRVRAAKAETGQNITSPWSEARTFTIAAGPEARVKLTNPANGAIVPPTNIQFTWDIVPDATGYVFSLKNPVAGTDVVASTNVAGTTYTYTGTLSYDTPYLWTVKAMKGEVVFGEATATFTTSAVPVAPEKPSTPPWVWVAIVLGVVVWLVILVLIFRTRRG
jgi:hypothetical protein